jgi:hypothetical protein
MKNLFLVSATWGRIIARGRGAGANDDSPLRVFRMNNDIADLQQKHLPPL